MDTQPCVTPQPPKHISAQCIALKKVQQQPPDGMRHTSIREHQLCNNWRLSTALLVGQGAIGLTCTGFCSWIVQQWRVHVPRTVRLAGDQQQQNDIHTCKAVCLSFTISASFSRARCCPSASHGASKGSLQVPLCLFLGKLQTHVLWSRNVVVVGGSYMCVCCCDSRHITALVALHTGCIQLEPGHSDV